MERIIQSLRKIMQSVDLKTVTKADLKGRYLSEEGLTKLPKEDKELFSSAVKTVYLEFISSNSSGQEISEKENEKNKEKVQSKIQASNADSDTSDEEPLQSFKETSKKGLSAKCYSEDDNLEKKSPLSAKNSDIEAKISNDSSDSNDEPLISLKNKSSLKNSIASENSSSDEKPLIKFSKNNKKKSITRLKNKNLIKSDNGFSESDDEILINVKNTSKKRISAITSSESEGEPLITLKKTVKKQTISCSDDSEEEPLIKVKEANKKSSNFDESEEEILINLKKNVKKQSISSNESDEDFKIKNEKKPRSKSNSNKLKTERRSNNKSEDKLKSVSNDQKLLTKKRKQKPNVSLNSSSSDEEPLATLQKDVKKQKPIEASDDLQSKIEKNHLTVLDNESGSKTGSATKKQKTNVCLDSSDSDEASLATFQEDAKKLNSVVTKAPDEAKSELNKDEDLDENSKKNSINFSDSEDSDNETIINLKHNPKIKSASKRISSDSDESLENTEAYVSKASNDESILSLKEKIIKKETLETDDDLNSTSFQKEETVKSISSDSDEEPLIAKKISFNGNRSIMTDSEEEPLNTLKSSVAAKKNEKGSIKIKDKGRKRKLSNSSEDEDTKKELNFSDSDEEPLLNLKKSKKEKNASFGNPNKKTKISPKVNKSKKKSNPDSFETQMDAMISSESEYEKLDSKEKISNSHAENLDVDMKSEQDNSSDENDEEIIDKKSKSSDSIKNSNSNKKAQKKPSASENKLEHLKKYVRAAGIRIQSYTKLFEKCKSMKSKCEKLTDLLEEAGVKGRPTLQKCKKVKEKNETKKEASELDLSNIITSKGRPKRTALLDNTNYKSVEDGSPFKQKFSRLQGIIDSEDSE